MLIGTVNNAYSNRVNVNRVTANRNQTSFRGLDTSVHEDEFVSKPHIVKGNINEENTNIILNTVKNDKPIGTGWTSTVYKNGNMIIKTSNKNAIKSQNLAEYYALSTIEKIDSSIAARPFGIIQDKDNFYLIEEFIDGKQPKGNKLTTEHLSDLHNKFFKLDTNCIANCDLQSGNIFLTSDNKTKLIDFGSFNFVTNDGDIASSDWIRDIDACKEQIYNDTSENASVRLLKTFFKPDKPSPDIKNLSDNPYIKTPSNATNFEFRTLYSHLLDNSEENPLEFFKGYLKSKAKNYHAKLQEFLKKLSFDEIDTTSFPKEKVQNSNKNFNKH